MCYPSSFDSGLSECWFSLSRTPYWKFFCEYWQNFKGALYAEVRKPFDLLPFLCGFVVNMVYMDFSPASSRRPAIKCSFLVFAYLSSPFSLLLFWWQWWWWWGRNFATYLSAYKRLTFYIIKFGFKILILVPLKPIEDSFFCSFSMSNLTRQQWLPFFLGFDRLIVRWFFYFPWFSLPMVKHWLRNGSGFDAPS